MGENVMANDSSLDLFLQEITTDIITSAIEKVSELVLNEMEIDENFLLQPLDSSASKISNVEAGNSLISHSKEMNNISTKQMCSTFVDETLCKVYDEIVLNQSTSCDISATQQKMQSLERAAISFELAEYIQKLTQSIIDETYNKVIENYKMSQFESNSLCLSTEKDESSVLQSEKSVIDARYLSPNICTENGSSYVTAFETIEESYEDTFVSAQSKTTDGANSTGELNKIISLEKNTGDKYMENTIDSVSKLPQQSTPVNANESVSNIFERFPTSEEKMKVEAVDEGWEQLVIPVTEEEQKHLGTSVAQEGWGYLGTPITEQGKESYEMPFDDYIEEEESSFGEPSSPRTLSRQSSTFGNVTLEFDSEWEVNMKGMEQEIKSGVQGKHKVILHELSFDDSSHRLKAPELLCPVFLAVQDDEIYNDDNTKTLQRKAQSINDLCEMISDDSEDDTEVPMRRRAVSLEQVTKYQGEHKKVPTREELMTAFDKFHHEILEDKEFDISKEETNDKEPIKENIKTDSLRWHTVIFNGQHKLIDLKLLEPFLKVLTHGGYHHEGDKKMVVVVLTACNLPDKKLKRYSFLMEQLFYFIVSTMDLLVTSDEYIFVYFHGGTNKNQSPSFSWLKKYYQFIDHRLRKSVSQVYVVHPDLWLKSVFRLCRPFISSNFVRKLTFVNTLKELSSLIQTDYIFIPDEVKRVDPDYWKIYGN